MLCIFQAHFFDEKVMMCYSISSFYLLIMSNFAERNNVIICMNLFATILLMIVSPTIGWEKIGRLSIPTKVLQGKVFFPTLAVLAVSAMFKFLYGDFSLTEALINAIIAFAAYFFTFYISSMVMNFISPGDTQDAKNRLDNLMIFAIEYLVLINIISNMLPSHFTILEFLKLYVAFILFRGLDYINYKEKPVFFVTIATLSVLIIPVAIKYVLGLIMPVAN